MTVKNITTLLFLVSLFWWTGVSGQNILTLEEAVSLGVKNSAAYKASALLVEQSTSLQKTAFNLPNPDLIAESPTGDFYAIGILQPLEFPTVYFNQGKVLKQSTLASMKQKTLTETEVRRLIKSLYLNLQFTQAFSEQLKVQDSLYESISKSAVRQFDAGVIDNLAKTFALSQYGEIHNQFIQAQTDNNVALNQLKSYTGISENITATPYERFIPSADVLQLLPQKATDSAYIYSSPSIQYLRELKGVSKKSLSLQKSRAMPGLVVGFLNQGPRETATTYKFRVGVRLPLWFWQYRGNISAAKAEVRISDQNIAAGKQQLSANMQQAVGDYTKFVRSVDYYENTGIQRANDVINTALRFFQSGQTDYINYLRSTNDAYAIKLRYLETLRSYNQSIINLYYLTGTN